MNVTVTSRFYFFFPKGKQGLRGDGVETPRQAHWVFVTAVPVGRGSLSPGGRRPPHAQPSQQRRETPRACAPSRYSWQRQGQSDTDHAPGKCFKDSR